jgi:hypothetical protein
MCGGGAGIWRKIGRNLDFPLYKSSSLTRVKAQKRDNELFSSYTVKYSKLFFVDTLELKYISDKEIHVKKIIIENTVCL